MDRDFLRELFEPIGPIDIKRMFGGLSLSVDGLTFAMLIRDQLYLKADVDSASRFAQEGCEPFSYEAKGRGVTVMSYWQMPERLYDDPEEAVQWGRVALAAARQVALAKPSKPRKPKAR